MRRFFLSFFLSISYPVKRKLGWEIKPFKRHPLPLGKRKRARVRGWDGATLTFAGHNRIWESHSHDSVVML